MITNVEFFSTPFSKANRYFPIPSSGFEGYRVHTENRVKMNEDIDKVITIPTFSGWDNCNIARIDGEYYWITHSGSNTLKQGSVSFVLEYNAVSSIIRPNQNITAWYDKCPSRHGNIKFSVEPDSHKISRKVPFGRLPIYHDETTQTDQLYFVQVTATEGHIESVAKSTMFKYGCFVRCDVNTDDFDGFLSYRQHVTAIRLEQDRFYYPSLKEIIDDADVILGIPADSIIDVSISVRCPYDVRIDTSRGYDRVGLNNKRNVSADVGNLAPNIFTYENPRGETEQRALMLLNPPISNAWTEPLITLLYPKPANPITYNISLSNMEQDTGLLSIVGDDNNDIFNIPTEWTSYQSRVYTYSDYNGIYTVIEIGDRVLTVPEGKVPWLGDSWNQYKIRQMDSDRASMDFAWNQAKDQRNIDIMNGISGGIMSGAMASLAGNPAGIVTGVASAGIGVITSEANNRLTQRQLRFEQDQKERQTKNSPSPNLSVGYGLNYVFINTQKDGLGYCVSVPANLTTTKYNNYINEYGYPSEGLRTIMFSGSGYVKGRTPESLVNGKKGELLNLELVEGFKFRVV